MTHVYTHICATMTHVYTHICATMTHVYTHICATITHVYTHICATMTHVYTHICATMTHVYTHICTTMTHVYTHICATMTHVYTHICATMTHVYTHICATMTHVYTHICATMTHVYTHICATMAHMRAMTSCNTAWRIYIHMCDMTHICDMTGCDTTWRIHTHMCNMTHQYLWHDELRHHMTCIHTYVRHDSWICVTWIIRRPWRRSCDTAKLSSIDCTRKCPVSRYEVATISRLLQIVGLFCKRALSKRRYSTKETYNLKEPTAIIERLHSQVSRLQVWGGYD